MSYSPVATILRNAMMWNYLPTEWDNYETSANNFWKNKDVENKNDWAYVMRIFIHIWVV